ncbi:protein FAR1-RELATED SEQUENCE 5-like [Henckelia pumila]|uniref:protein FAR1-RELATED SEQUENCE 5-like n=1 Tax=Henckelia pumila TaxID=405737 RepID=UPI003C6E176C
MEDDNSLEVLEGDYSEEVEIGDIPNMQGEVPDFSVQENEVQIENSITDVLESKLKVGQIVKSVEDAYLLYCQYAHAKGFSVRKGDQRCFSHTNELQSKEFNCSCEGSKDEKRSSKKVAVYQKPITRTNCKAKLKITREKEGEWRVSRFVEEHNHEMFAHDQSYLLRSARNISHAKKSTLEAMVNAGIPVSSAVSFMENEACGPENLGFIRKDAYDHMSRLKKHTKVENGDATTLIQYFTNKTNNENYFYWNMQLDDDDRVMNFFFRDYRCAVDYECFGDILSIDTTYRTNKYNLICAPFVGINHHLKNVMFGLAFLSDETESSFEWLFTTFLDSMNGKQPQTIFSDQCQAMMNAIETVFPQSHHRLCQWHINQNAPSHFGSLNGNSAFKNLWYKCMNYCESEDEFEVTWRKMICIYNLDSHKWLNGMYKLRSKWATAFSNEKFSAGLLATSRSEATNRALKKAGNKTISLYEFVMNYTKIQNKWREKEKAEDTRCRHGKPGQILKNHPLLIHAADVYTISIYQLFEMELINSLNCKNVEASSCYDNDWNWIEIKVKSHDEHSRVRCVLFNKLTKEIKCTCHKFETMGILCKHVLMVFNSMDVTVLPNRYILKRWTKNVRNREKSVFEDSGSGIGGHVSELVFVNQIIRSVYDLTQLSKSHDDARTILFRLVDTAKDEITDLVQTLNLDDEIPCEDIQNDGHVNEEPIRDPLTAKAKGVTNANITRHWEKKSKKGKGKGKAEISCSKGSKRKGKNSQDATNTEEMNNISSQNSNLTISQYPLVSSQIQFPFGYTQHLSQYSHGMGNPNLYPSGQMNFFPYHFGGPHSSQGNIHGN